jgi:NADPH:quinone reductase-like Zn-dependent oxidoreductase
MRAAGIKRIGGPVELIEIPDPRAPGPGEALIRVHAAGVGNWDEIVRTGGWTVGRGAPLALGVEAAGTVVALGSGVKGWAEGDEVLTHPLPLVDQGAWAPSLIAPALLLSAKPREIGWAQAGALPVPALTAAQVLDALRIRRGEQLLVNGAGGVTGGLIVALAAKNGVDVAATAGPSSAERVRRAGARVVLDHRDPNWPGQLRALTDGVGVVVAANAARAQAQAAIAAVRDGGRLVTITSDPPPPARGIAVESLYVRPDAAQLTRTAVALAGGQLSFVVAAEFGLEDARSALEYAVQGAGGAVVLRP